MIINIKDLQKNLKYISNAGFIQVTQIINLGFIFLELKKTIQHCLQILQKSFQENIN